jgi:hypothetical protein
MHARAQAADRARAAEAAAALAAERAALEEAALPLMLEAMWAANTLDIQHTVKAVCQQVARLTWRQLLTTPLTFALCLHPNIMRACAQVDEAGADVTPLACVQHADDG